MSDSRTFLRHTLATLAYRGGKTLVGSPEGFLSFRAGPSSRSAGEILAHVGDLLDWTSGMLQGQHVWTPVAARSWDEDAARFHTGLVRLDAYLASGQPLGASAERIFQGPIADALTHVGQLALLRRLAGSPVAGENYFRADITTGRVGVDQPPPVQEF